MFKAHELLAMMGDAWGEDSSPYKTLVESVKFDLGDFDDVATMVNLSSLQFFNLPAPVSMFQMEDGGATFIFLAKQHDDDIVWTMFGDRVMVKGHVVREWYCASVMVSVSENRYAEAYSLDNNELLDINSIIKDPNHASNYHVLSILNIIKAIEVLSLSNVYTVENQPPKHINAKRKKKGKIPFFSYHTLHIGNPRKKGSNEEMKGSHASPRLHFRRGHIRTLSDGRRLWINACLVGDKTKGIVTKDYKVKQGDL